MVSVNFTENKYSNLSALDTMKDDNRRMHGAAFVKHKLHENKVDEFFWTDVEAPHKRFSPLALIGSIIGVGIPLFMLGRSRNKEIKIDSVKNFFKSMDIKYDLKAILATGLGGALGGLAGGLLDRKEKNKLDKIQEGVFQIFNISLPALFVAGGIKLCEEVKALNKIPIKILASALGMLSGVFLAVKIANKIDNKLFDKYNVEPDRKFKKKDFIVHVDDIIATLVLAKIPIAEKLHVEKFLPAIFAWSGFHIGEK